MEEFSLLSVGRPLSKNGLASNFFPLQFRLAQALIVSVDVAVLVT